MYHPIPTDDEVEANIVRLLNTWNKNSSHFAQLVAVLGILSIGGSLFVTTFLGYKDDKDGSFLVSNIIIKIVSLVSSMSLTAITAFNLDSRKNKIRSAWRVLNSAYFRYKTKEINMQELIKIYKECEISIGQTSFTYQHHITNSAIE